MRWAYKALVKAKEEREAATKIQTRIRIFLAKEKAAWLAGLRKRRRAAAFIQRVYRGYVARAIASSKRQEILETESAVRIQGLARQRAAVERVRRLRRRKEGSVIFLASNLLPYKNIFCVFTILNHAFVTFPT